MSTVFPPRQVSSFDIPENIDAFVRGVTESRKLSRSSAENVLFFSKIKEKDTLAQDRLRYAGFLKQWTGLLSPCLQNIENFRNACSTKNKALRPPAEVFKRHLAKKAGRPIIGDLKEEGTEGKKEKKDKREFEQQLEKATKKRKIGKGK